MQIAENFLNDRQQAEDLVQEALIKVYTVLSNPKLYTEQHRFSQWIGMVTKNASINQYRDRKRKLRVTYQDDLTHCCGFNYQSDDTLERRFEMADDVEKLLAALPEEDADILSLRYLGDYKYWQIAELTETKIGTVKSKLHRYHYTLRDDKTPLSRTGTISLLRAKYSGKW